MNSPFYGNQLYTIAAASLEYIKVSVAKDDGSNPTGDAVFMAVVADNYTPQSGDWLAASWQTIGTSYLARCLVGPGGTKTLTAGTWVLWLKVTDSPEVLARRIGYMQVI